MTVWTTPTHVSSGEADSGKFNEETVDNLLYLYGGMPRVYQASLSGGPTSGTTELLLTGTVTIPAQAVDMIVVPSVMARVQASVSGDYFQVAIRSTNISGAIRGFARNNPGDATGRTKTISVPMGEAYALAAGVGEVLVATLQRTDGSGTGSLVTATGGGNFLTALLVPDL